MSTSQIEKVSTVFQGIASRDPQLTTKYMNPMKYTQHNPRAADGVEGLREYVGQLPAQNHCLKMVRAFQDGPYVFTQEEGLIFGQGVFFDIFRFEEGLIVEHWVFSAKASPPNKIGHTQTDGPPQAKHDDDTEKNKSIMRAYYETVHIAGDHSKIPQYFSGDYCVRHEPGVRDGVAAFTRDVDWLMQHRTIDELTILLGQGDFVFIAAKGTQKGQPCVYVELYRIEDEKIVEHWGFPENIPPREEWKNINGML
jgi:predicted SnoaL-like aldol condensation-catalyzing enzyme